MDISDIAESILETVFGAAERYKAISVEEVGLAMSVSSEIEASELKFLMECFKVGTIADSAKITIRYVSAKGICEKCGSTIIIDHIGEKCVNCGYDKVRFEDDYRLQIDYINLEGSGNDGENRYQ